MQRKYQHLIAQENHYYPFGMNTVGIEKKGEPNHQYQYNSKEKQEDFDLGWLDYGWRNYDATIGRFLRIDRFAEKYYDLTPYQYCANNPVLFIDVNGDSLSLAIFMIADRMNNTNYTQQMVNDLINITGLDLTVDETTGLLNYNEAYSSIDADGQAIILQDADGNQIGSASAREYLQNVIDGNLVNVETSPDRSVTPAGGNQVFLSANQINNFINATPDVLNNSTMGFGMTLLHELHHTGPGGDLRDVPDRTDIQSVGDVESRVNNFRRELDANPANQNNNQKFGERMHYNAVPFGNNRAYVNFQYNTTNRNGSVVRKTTRINF
ncbi:MAG: hypothetical protein EAZ55_13645 [Cytophagales bacterium]|nr:MAG: hypothetical protein EAZ55_13645 [Cytophagales bacterium]